MSLNYFSQYPTVKYTRPAYGKLSGTNIEVELTDLLVRFKIQQAILDNSALFYPYIWQDDDRPDIIADKYYGSSAYFWVVFFSNGAFDYNYDFPMPADVFNKFLIAKYANVIISANSYTQAQWDALTEIDKLTQTTTYLKATVKYYQFFYNDNPSVIFNCGYNQYSGIASSDISTTTLSIYDYENNINEAKRNVNLIDNDFLRNIVREFTGDMNTISAGREALGDI